ncbi:glucose dehydrogenase [FAD, quinone]-like [Planococcus citri]|uniref:glucose dehydrogenase [FAD, quinone]-like n=1 Tax=Planococcus citri TaxID=170843 RepID=UPI0031F7D2F5
MDSMNDTCPLLSTYSFLQPLSTLPILAPLILSNCHLTSPYPSNKAFNVYLQHDPEYDFIIIGAGSAGCVIANRLSEISNWKVLLIEAGTDPPILSDIPSLFPLLLQTPYDWDYSTEPATQSCLGYVNNQCKWPRGKTLGGSSSINAMLAVRGNRKDYDNWESMGNPGWGYDHVMKYFKKLERVFIPRWGNDSTLGYAGNVFVEDYTNNTLYDIRKIINYMAKYYADLGYNTVEDFYAHPRAGLTSLPGTLRDDVRWSSAKAYLTPARNRPNLVVMKSTLATKILINERKKAYGVEVLNYGKYKKIYCKKEVIVSAGSINSPQILMLSGIGPKNHLRELNIDTIQDLKVGYNLQDHIAMVAYVAQLNLKNYTLDLRLLDFPYGYLSERIDTGILPNTMLFFNTTGNTEDYPDIQTYHILVPRIPMPIFLPFPLEGLRVETVNKIINLAEKAPSILITPALVRPKSRGRVYLNSKDPLDKIKIISGYLTAEEDVKTMVEVFKILRKLSQSQAFKQHATLTHIPVEVCSKFVINSDRYYECLLRHLCTTAYHPSGTCKMGPSHDADAVVSPELKMYGISGLRVADSSIMPQVTSSNTNIPTMMIGEKASDMIKKDWL